MTRLSLRPSRSTPRRLLAAVRRSLGLAALLSLVSASVLLGGCGRGFVIETPAGFAELEDQQDYGYRAANAEGVVIAVRREKNSPHGDLDFWTGAVDAHLRRQGYVAEKALDIESANGIAGRQIRYQSRREGRAFVFWMSVFATEDHVVVIEVGGDKDYFDKLEPAVSAAIRSLRIG